MLERIFSPAFSPAPWRSMALMILLVLGFTGLYTWATWQQVSKNLIAELSTVTELGEKSADHYFQLLHVSLSGLAEELQQSPTADGQYDLERVRRYSRRHPELLDVSLIRQDGQMLLSTQADVGTVMPSLAARDTFMEARETMIRGQNFVFGRPTLGTLTQRWMIPLRHALRDRQGSLQAMVTAYLPAELLQTFWQDAPIVKRAAIGILGDDGYLRSRYPNPASASMQQIYGQQRRGALMKELQARRFPSQGTLQGRNEIGGQENLNVYRRMSHYPATLFVTLPMQEMRAVWWSNMQVPYFLISLLLAGLLLVQRSAHRRRLELLRQQEMMQLARARLAAIVESSDDAIISHDLEERIVSWNPGASRLLGYTEAEALGQSSQLIVPQERQAEEDQILQRVRQGERAQRIETQRLHRDGTRLDVELTLSPLSDEAGRITGVSNIMRDISERKSAEQAIHVLAYFDPLTGLPNRRQFMDRLSQTLSQAQSGFQVGALLFIDLDHFKDVNDARGHAVGDAVLCHAAAVLVSLLREGHLVARLGGDEFVVLAPILSNTLTAGASEAMALAERIRQRLAQPFELEQQRYSLGASIGVSLFPFGQQTPADLLREADTAMYRAKGAGRNRIAFFETSMQADIEQRLALENDLEKALAQQQMVVYLQPQFDARGQIDGAELLLRWQHPERGLVPPDRFIAAAEKSGQIIALGDWVLQQACELLVLLQTRGHDIPLSINVSPRQFRQPDFVGRVKEVLQRTGAPASSLIFEVTEGLLIDDFEETVARMLALAQLGIRFSIDDFGTGYSSLAYLKRLPLYELKIDRSFVKDTPEDPNDTAIVRMILSMAKHLGLRVVAEGVETAEQADFLRQSHCDALQGYLFARPAPAWQWLAAQTQTQTQTQTH